MSCLISQADLSTTDCVETIIHDCPMEVLHRDGLIHGIEATDMCRETHIRVPQNCKASYMERSHYSLTRKGNSSGRHRQTQKRRPCQIDHDNIRRDNVERAKININVGKRNPKRIWPYAIYTSHTFPHYLQNSATPYARTGAQ
jgi:hypothetical protein